MQVWEKEFTKNIIKKKLNSTYLQTKEKREYFSLIYYQRHKKEIQKYCIQDCILTKELGENWIEDTAGWWGSKKVSDNDFINGIKWLIENGILKI